MPLVLVIKRVAEAAVAEELEVLVIVGEELGAEVILMVLKEEDLVCKVEVLLVVDAELINDVLLEGLEVAVEEELTVEGAMLVVVKELVLLIVGEELVVLLLLVVSAFVEPVLWLFDWEELVVYDKLDEELVTGDVKVVMVAKLVGGGVVPVVVVEVVELVEVIELVEEGVTLNMV